MMVIKDDQHQGQRRAEKSFKEKANGDDAKGLTKTQKNGEKRNIAEEKQCT